MSAYEVGSHLEVELLGSNSSSSKVSFEILHAYTPFTLSVVLRARLLQTTAVLQSGTIVILKLLDRRFIDEEGRQRRKQDWTEHREHLARERWQAIDRGHIEDDYDSEADEEDWKEAWNEEQYHRSTMKWFGAETEAYKRLSDYQGKHIPRLYHTFRAPDNHPGQTISLDVNHLSHGFVLQYLESAVTGADISDPAAFPNLREHTRNIMSAMSSFCQPGPMSLP